MKCAFCNFELDKWRIDPQTGLMFPVSPLLFKYHIVKNHLAKWREIHAKIEEEVGELEAEAWRIIGDPRLP